MNVRGGSRSQSGRIFIHKDKTQRTICFFNVPPSSHAPFEVVELQSAEFMSPALN